MEEGQHFNGVVLYVRLMGRMQIICSFTAQWFGTVVYDIWFIWSLLGNAVFGMGFVGVLDGGVW